MRQLFLAAFGVLALAGAASAQQPRYAMPPTQYPVVAPGTATTPTITPTGAQVIRGDGGCTNCGPKASGYTMSSKGYGIAGYACDKCMYGYPCQNGCGSLKSDLAFHFGTCKSFFDPCGPTHCGLLGHKCFGPFAQPWGQGWTCPRNYDTYMNH
jgi:hypothetical protein